jgi:hypothetical protein
MISLIVDAASPANAAGGTEPRQLAKSTCDYDRLARALRRLPATDIFTPLDIGPQILVETPHRLVATGHHRNVSGIHDVIAAFVLPADQARSIVARRHASLLIVCPDQVEPDNYRRFGPKGLMADLLAGRPPKWLTPIDLAPGSRFSAWRVANR